jgi:hypothetical protein
MHQKSFYIGLMVFLALIPGFAGCSGMPESRAGEDYSTDSIVIHNIPLSVHGQPAYKVYVYVTNSMSQHDRHKAQGTALLDGATSITIPLYEPLDDYRGKDPDDYGKPWSGTGSYFSVIISPLDAPGKEAILVKGGQALNKPNREHDFKRLISISESSMFANKVEAIYTEIIRADRQGIGSDITTP